jgi:pimeloyl-ACP methyl ester carboxylesterase
MNVDSLIWVAAGFTGIGAVLALVGYLKREPLPMNDATRKRARGSFLRLSQGTTHYLEEGSVDGETVVLVPGATLSLWIWDGLAERLAAAGYRVIRYDLLGRGYSDRPKIVYGPDTFDRQLEDLLAALDVKAPVHLVGLAFGCPIIAEFGRRHPSAVKQLCLLAPDGFGVALSSSKRFVHLPVIGSYFFRLVGDKALEQRLAAYSPDPAVIERVRAQYLPELKFKGFKRALLSSIRNMPIHDARSLYHKVDALLKTTLIWGKADRVTPMPDESELESVFPRANRHFLDGMGHLPHHEQPDLTAKLVLKALRGDAAVTALTKQAFA